MALALPALPPPPAPGLAAYDRGLVARGGFKAFVRLAWEHFDPAPLVWSWHLDVVCDALEEIARLRYEVEQLPPDELEALLAERAEALTRAMAELEDGEELGPEADRLNPLELALCVPPFSSKTNIASICFQPWVWTWWPESRWITSTYEKDLAYDHSETSRDLVASPWYQERWPLRLTRTAVGYWRNERGGWRRAVGTGGSITGKHAHFHVGDDLVKEQLSRLGTPSQIAAALGKATSFWFTTLGTRRTKQAVARILIGQRLAVDDTPGVAMRDHGYRSIVLAARYEPERAHPLDRRTEPGELLCPARMNDQGLRRLERTIGPLAARAQLQQDPVPLGGRVIELEWLGHRYRSLPAEIRQAMTTGRPGIEVRALIAWDLSFKGKESSSRVAGQVWAWFRAKAWLIDAVVQHAGFLAALDLIGDLHSRYPWITTTLLEDAANAPACQEVLEDMIPGCQLEPHGGGTLARTQAVVGLWAAGDVMLPAEAEWMGGASGFVAEHSGFDGLKTRPDDQVSASSLALLAFVTSEGTPAWSTGAAALREMVRAGRGGCDDDHDEPLTCSRDPVGEDVGVDETDDIPAAVAAVELAARPREETRSRWRLRGRR